MGISKEMEAEGGGGGDSVEESKSEGGRGGGRGFVDESAEATLIVVNFDR